MSETNELAQLLQKVEALQAEVELLKQGQSTTSTTNLSKATQSPTSRRKMLKAGVLAAGLAVTGAAATAIAPHSAEAASGDTITVAGTFSPDSSASAPTHLLNPGGANGLSSILFQVDNTNGTTSGTPSNSRVAIAGITSGYDGPDSVTKIGVYGASDTGFGIYGVGEFAGVYAASTNGTAVLASSSNGYGIQAYGSTAIIASGNTYGGNFTGASAHLYLPASGTPPLSRTNAHTAGEIIFDSSNNAWICVTSGSPGTWRQLAGSNTAGSFHVLPSITRMIDTRSGHVPAIPASLTYSSTGGTFSSPMAAGETRTYSLNVTSTPVPAGATAISAVVTAVNPTMTSGTTGYFQFWSGAVTPLPTGAQVTYNAPGIANAGFFITSLTTGATPDTFNIYTLRATEVTIDIVGYYL